jgi:two-component system nitrogen regulation sensor histidine kinase GlnL
MAETMTATPLSAEDLLQAHPVATFMVSRNGLIQFVNQAAEQLANMGRAALLGRSLFDIVRLPPEQEARLRALDQRAYLAHGLTMTVGQGSSDLIDLQFVPLGESGNRLLTLAPVIGAGEFLALGSKGGGRSATAAASMLAHEIKNPLAGIRGAAQLIARQPDGEVARFTDLIVAEVDRIAALIDRMQHFSRGQPLACTATNIYPAIAQTSDSLRAAHPAIRLIDDFDPSIPLAHANHDAVVQILMNLVANAADALRGQADAAIRISTSYRHGLLLDHSGTGGRTAVPIEICVADNGPGVDPELVEAIFDPFVTTKRDGQGLGLALVARLARDMRGAVQYRRKGGWTQFRLHLPAAARQSEGEEG